MVHDDDALNRDSSHDDLYSESDVRASHGDDDQMKKNVEKIFLFFWNDFFKRHRHSHISYISRVSRGLMREKNKHNKDSNPSLGHMQLFTTKSYLLLRPEEDERLDRLLLLLLLLFLPDSW